MNTDNKQVRTAKNGMPYVPARLVEGKNQWYIQYHIYDEESATLKKKRFYKIKGDTPTQKRKDARAHIQNLNRALRSGVYIQSTFDDAPQEKSIKQGLEYVIELKKKNLGHRSSSHYRLSLGEFIKYLKNNNLLHLPINKIDQSHIALFLDYIQSERNLSAVTRNNYRRFIFTAFREMIVRAWIKENPVAGIPIQKQKSKEYRSFTKPDYEKLNNYLREKHPRLWEFTQFIFYGFIRPVEVTRLRIEHIRLDKRVILVSPTDAKNGEFKPVEITRSLRYVIENMNLEDYPPHHYIFSGSKGWPPGKQYLWRNRVSEAHRRVLEDLGLYNKVYDLYSHKHTGNERALEASMDIYWIMRQNRHSSLEQTQIYLRGLGIIRKEAQEKDW
ncbi:MAG: tyrosine-type recombinase/integrase [Bacteroidota bacterium]